MQLDQLKRREVHRAAGRLDVAARGARAPAASIAGDLSTAN